MLSRLRLALVGSLGIGASSATAQAVYFGTYEPLPIVEPYQVVTAPPYIVRPPLFAPPIVRERTIVVSRPRFVSAPFVAPPMLPPYVVTDW